MKHYIQEIRLRNHLKPNFKPLRLIVNGSAGSGKSYLIFCIRQLLKDDECLVFAPTGIAALNVCGQTESSALLLPIRGKRENLSVKSLEKLRDSLMHVICIILDERSMKGQVGMA